jgi:hypothetical protein
MSDIKKTYISFTIDVDPDINVPSRTRPGAVSHPVESGKVRFESVQKGLILLVELFNELGINATFFFEARTAKILNERINLAALMHGHEVGCHSYEHEDFTATDRGLELDLEKKQNIIKKSLTILNQIFPHHSILGFRAPYIKIDLDLALVIERYGFTYDSSISLDWCHDRKDQKFKPRYITGTNRQLIELPLPVWQEEGKKSLSSYLWPILESDRNFNEYWLNISRSIEVGDDELVILATHPWHLVETYKKGQLNDTEIEANLKLVEKLLTQINSIPAVEFMRLDKYLEITPVELDEIKIENR